MFEVIKEILKTMGEGFKLANEGEMLSERQKNDVLTEKEKSVKDAKPSPEQRMSPMFGDALPESA